MKIQYCFICKCNIVGWKKWKYHRFSKNHIQNYYNDKLNEVTINS